MSDESVGAGPEERAVLVVEDEPGVRLFIQTVLARNGYAPLAAGSAAEALRVADEHRGRIGLVISDLMLPDMHGRKLVGILREGAPGLPAVFISGFLREESEGRGSEGFVEKPFRAQELLEAARRALL